MKTLESHFTAELAPRKRAAFWDQIGSAFTSTVTDPIDMRSFAPSLTRGCVEDLCIAEVNFGASIVQHYAMHEALTRAARYCLHIQLEGCGLRHQDGREALLQQCDFTLLDNTRPFQLRFAAPSRVLIIGFPEAPLRRQLASPQSVVAVRMSYQQNLAGMLSDFAQGFWRECVANISDVSPTLTQALLRLVGGAYTGVREACTHGSASLVHRRVRLLNYIEKHLGDSSLSPATMAASLRTSARSLHVIFETGPETLSRYILRRRLEECARTLANPVHCDRTISDIALDCGFTSCTHFGRVFRNHFGLAPTLYRRQSLASGSV